MMMMMIMAWHTRSFYSEIEQVGSCVWRHVGLKGINTIMKGKWHRRTGAWFWLKQLQKYFNLYLKLINGN